MGEEGGGRGSPTLARAAQCGGSGVTEAAAAGPKPGPGRSAMAAAPSPSPSADSPEEEPMLPINPPHHSRPPAPEQFPVPLPSDRLCG